LTFLGGSVPKKFAKSLDIRNNA